MLRCQWCNAGKPSIKSACPSCGRLPEFNCEKCGCKAVPVDSIKNGDKYRECIRALNSNYERCEGTDLFKSHAGSFVL